MAKCDLKIDWAIHAAAKHAYENWHYSQCVPVGKLVKIGAWESDKFIGVVLFGRGANRHMAQEFGLQSIEVAELVRVALSKHKVTTSKILAFSIKMLRRQYPAMRLLVSYADTKQEHVGTIYQATNWIYTGVSQSSFSVFFNGRWMHPRSVNAVRGTIKGLPVRQDPKKHRYIMPLDNEMRKRILPLARPYPKRAGSDTTDTAGLQPAEGGSIPTPALHSQG